jgi:hypothetical protein
MTTERMRQVLLRRIGRYGIGRMDIHSAILEGLVKDSERAEKLKACCDSLNEDRERAIHAAFCAGIRYVVGNRELKPEELAEALRYTGKQSELSSGEGAEVAF